MNITIKEFTEEQKSLHRLLIETTKTRDIGLLSGKMGAAILFYTYDRSTSQKMYTNLADDLLDKVWSEISKETPTNFSTGLWGIGWGTEYLIQNGFVEGEGADICEDINLRIMNEDPRRISDLSLEKGLCGLLHYLLIHIRGCIQQNTKLGFDTMYIHDMHQRINSIPKDQMTDELSILISQYNKFYSEKENTGYEPDLQRFVEMIADIEESEKNDANEDTHPDTQTLSVPLPSVIDTQSIRVSIGLRNNIAHDLVNTFIN